MSRTRSRIGTTKESPTRRSSMSCACSDPLDILPTHPLLFSCTTNWLVFPEGMGDRRGTMVDSLAVPSVAKHWGCVILRWLASTVLRCHLTRRSYPSGVRCASTRTAKSATTQLHHLHRSHDRRQSLRLTHGNLAMVKAAKLRARGHNGHVNQEHRHSPETELLRFVYGALRGSKQLPACAVLVE